MASIRERKKTGLACNFSVEQPRFVPRGLTQEVSEYNIMGPKVDDISRELMKRLQDDKDMMLEQYKRRLSGKNLVRQFVQNRYEGLNVVVFGSSATLLFREDSDVDLCVYEKARKNPRNFGKKEQLKLLKSLTPLMGKMFKNTRLVGKAKVPVSRFDFPPSFLPTFPPPPPPLPLPSPFLPLFVPPLLPPLLTPCLILSLCLYIYLSSVSFSPARFLFILFL